MNSVCPCSLCGERDHVPWRCPVLRDPLREGFYKGGGGGGGGGGGDDDEKVDMGCDESVVASTKALNKQDNVKDASYTRYSWRAGDRGHRGDCGGDSDAHGLRAEDYGCFLRAVRC